MASEIEIKNVSKSYGAIKALDDVSLSIPEGKIFGIIGPDGAGKTTLFRILATLMLPEKGEASVCGFDTVKGMKEIRRRVGYMPGKFSLYQDLSVRENLEFFATIFGTTVAEGYPLIKDIYSQIERFENRRAGALSGGMKQKLALSCALVHQPEVLLLDEPTTGVDPVSRKEFWDMLSKLRERGITIVASTPYLDEVRRCDEVAFLHEGKIRGIGKPNEILEQVQDIFMPERPKRQTTPIPFREGLGGESAIKVSHLVKAFGSFHAVDDISFSVKRGEIFGFLGANGAGKTTAMRILSGLSQPTAGKATVAGFDVSTQYEDIKRHIGYMSQRFSLYEDMTVRENLQLFGGIYGVKSKEIKVKSDELLHQLGMEAYGDTIVKSLPLGWKQRLAFAVSIFHEPEVVFLDEPTGGVDPATRKQFWNLIYEAASRGITVFVTTHYMDEAEYCDRISIMVDGKIKAMGSPTELKEQYNESDMDGVFMLLARGAKRGDPPPAPSYEGREWSHSSAKATEKAIYSPPSKGGAGGRSFSSFVIKESKHILRDMRTMLVLFAMPLILMLLFGFAIRNDVQDIRTIVVTSSMDHQTQRLVDALDASEYFLITGTCETPAEAERLIRNQQADMAIVFSPRFASHSGANYQLIIDASDPNMAQQYEAYARQIIIEHSMFNVQSTLLYNPQMKSAYNFVPGIMGMLLLLICAMMTSVSIAKEKERGTMEVLLVSPVRPIMIIIAKAVPYFVLALSIMTVILLMARFVLGVPLSGGLFWIVVTSLIYILLGLALGLLISTVADSQMTALLFSAMVMLLPTLMLSGMIFPIDSMPRILQFISYIVPARYFISAMRRLMIMGVDVSVVIPEILTLIGMTLLLLIVSVKKFKTRLE